MSALNTSSRALFITDEKETARNIAEMQIEEIRSSSYSLAGYPSISSDDPGSEDDEEYANFVTTYPNYTIAIDANSLPRDPDTNLQRIEITVLHDSREIYSLVTFKENLRQ